MNEIHEKTSAGRKKVLRNNHPDMSMSQVGPAGVLLILGNSERSGQLTLEAYDILKKEGRITKEDPYRLDVHVDFGGRAAMAQNELEKQTWWEEAIEWGRQLVEDQECIIGLKHPETIKASQQLMSAASNRDHNPLAQKLVF